MKRILAALFAVCLAMTAFAQSTSIISDDADSNGDRCIKTDPVNCRNGLNDNYPIEWSLVCIVRNDVPYYALYLTFIRGSMSSAPNYFHIPNDGSMLIKLENDEVLELKNVRDELLMQDPAGKYLPSSKLYVHRITAYYPITEGDLDKINEYAIVKTRYETSDGTIDQEQKKNKAGSVIRKQYELIKEALTVKKDFYSDF